MCTCSKLILRNLDSLELPFQCGTVYRWMHLPMIYNCMLILCTVLFPGASAQTEEVHEEEIESGLEEKEEEEGEEQEVEDVVEEEVL